VRPDGGITIQSWNGDWQPPREHAPAGSAGGTITAVSRFTDHLDVFWVRPDGGITIQSWNGDWQPPREHAPAASAGGTITAVSRYAEHLDVYWNRSDGGITLQSWFGPQPAPDLPARLQFRLLNFLEHEDAGDGIFGGANDEVWMSGVGLDSAAVTRVPNNSIAVEPVTAPHVGDVSDDAVRNGWKQQPHVLLQFDLKRPSDWPRSFTVTLLIMEEDSEDLSTAFEKLQGEVGSEVKAAAITAAASATGTIIGSAVIPGIGTAVGAAVGAIVGIVYDEVIAAIEDGFANQVFSPIPMKLTVEDPRKIRQHADIGHKRVLDIREHGAFYQLEYDWHLVE
jgi:hypothetical protein